MTATVLPALATESVATPDDSPASWLVTSWISAAHGP